MNDGVDRLLGSIANVKRRRLLVALMEKNPQTVDHERAEQSETTDFEVEMHHVHLPKLEEAGIIEWDQRTGDIVKGPEFGDVEPLLECLRENEEALPGNWL